jgi:hypothetical protein
MMGMHLMEMVARALARWSNQDMHAQAETQQRLMCVLLNVETGKN